jgi:hypothetical protein
VLKAHRLSYELGYGDLPAGLDVCHHCDNPACVRPSHLFKGTRADNMADRYRKGRYGKPIIPPLDSLLPPDQAAEIRAIWSNPDHPPARELAQQFGVTLAALRLAQPVAAFLVEELPRVIERLKEPPHAG